MSNTFLYALIAFIEAVNSGDKEYAKRLERELFLLAAEWRREQ